MGAVNSAATREEQEEAAGREVMDVLQRLATDLDLEVELDDVDSEIGQRATRGGGSGGVDGRGGTREEGSRGAEGESESSEMGEEEATARLLASLFGARPNCRRITLREVQVPHQPVPMTPSCDFYREMTLCSSGLRDPGQAGPSKNVCHQVHSRKLHFDGLSHGRRVDLLQHMIPSYPCLVDIFMSRVFCGVYNKEGTMFISAVQDCTMHLYDTTGSKFDEYKVVEGRDVGWSILDVTFSPDQYWFAYSTWSPCINVCNVYGEEEKHYSLDLRPDMMDRFSVFSLQFSADGTELITACSDGYLYIYNREICDRTLKIDAHQDDADAVALDSHSPQIIYSAGDDGLCKVWDRRCLSETNPVPVGTLAGHKDGITFIDTKGDGRYLITNSKDQSIKLWDIRCFSEKEAVDATLGEVQRQSWDYRWQDVPQKALNDALVKLPGDSSVMTYAGHLVRNTLLRARFSPLATTGQRYIYTACAKGRVLFYDTLTGEVVKTLSNKKYENCVRDVHWNPTQPAELVTSSWDGILQLWSYRERPNLVEDTRRRYLFS